MSLKDTIKSFKEILEGKHDALPVSRPARPRPRPPSRPPPPGRSLTPPPLYLVDRRNRHSTCKASYLMSRRSEISVLLTSLFPSSFCRSQGWRHPGRHPQGREAGQGDCRLGLIGFSVCRSAKEKSVGLLPRLSSGPSEESSQAAESSVWRKLGGAARPRSEQSSARYCVGVACQCRWEEPYQVSKLVGVCVVADGAPRLDVAWSGKVEDDRDRRSAGAVRG